ncbi:MAG: hypothetical protein ACRCX8_08485 [Sarcina sp.]
MKGNIINGMTKEELVEAVEGSKLITEGLEIMLEQMELLEEGKEADNKIVRKAKVKMNEGVLIMNDIKIEQEKRAKAYNNKQFNRERRWNGKR